MSGGRRLVAYDDLVQEPAANSSQPNPPAKRRKTAITKGSRPEEESRELTHEEIWDDSALVDAWNAANEEYEAYHGPDKGWKNEPVNKSPLWYNVPRSTKKRTDKTTIESENSEEGSQDEEENEDENMDSKPLNFDTFVPTHDPSLDLPPLGQDSLAVEYDPTSYFLENASIPNVSRDEAFNRAMSSMYWAGYWTAVYHSHNRASKPEVRDEEMAAQSNEPLDE